MLQPDPRSGEGCNTLLHEGFANVDTRKRMLYRHCNYYTFLASTCAYDTIIEQRFKTTGRGFQFHYYMVVEGFISIEARSGHRLASVSVTGDFSNKRHLVFPERALMVMKPAATVY